MIFSTLFYYFLSIFLRNYSKPFRFYVKYSFSIIAFVWNWCKGFCEKLLDISKQTRYTNDYRAAGEIAVPCICNPLQQR